MCCPLVFHSLATSCPQEELLDPLLETYYYERLRRKLLWRYRRPSAVGCPFCQMWCDGPKPTCTPDQNSASARELKYLCVRKVWLCVLHLGCWDYGILRLSSAVRSSLHSMCASLQAQNGNPFRQAAQHRLINLPRKRSSKYSQARAGQHSSSWIM